MDYNYGNIVLASTKSGFIPTAIKWFTGSIFSHSLITIPNILGVPMGMEACESGVDAVRFDKNYADDPNQGYEVWEILVCQEAKDAAIVSCLNDLEIRYGYFQYPWFIWRRINYFFGRDIKGQDNWDTSGRICSQFCDHYIKNCLDFVDPSGILFQEIFKGYGKGSMAPQDLKDVFVNNPQFFRKKEEVRL